VCLDQCNDFEDQYLQFFANQDIGWQALEALATQINSQIAGANNAILLTQQYQQFATLYRNIPHLSKLAQSLQVAVTTIGSRYTNYRAKLLQIQSLINPLNVNANLGPYFLQFNAIANFSYLLWNPNQASQVQTVCGFDPCVALSTTTQEIASAVEPSLGFVDGSQLEAVVQKWSMFWNQQADYNSINTTLLGPLTTLINQNYKSCNSANVCTTLKGLSILSSTNPTTLSTFSFVVQSVDNLINQNFPLLQNKLILVSNYWTADFNAPVWRPPIKVDQWPSIQFTYANQMEACYKALSS